MVSSERETFGTRRNARYVMLGAVAGVAAVCAVAVIATRPTSTNLVDRPNALYMDSMNVANKILHAQKFKKADEQERKSVVKSILADGHEHKSGKKIVSGVAAIVANTKLSYHQRMEAMKKLLDDQTDAIKSKPLHRSTSPSTLPRRLTRGGEQLLKDTGQRRRRLLTTRRPCRRAPSYWRRRRTPTSMICTLLRSTTRRCTKSLSTSLLTLPRPRRG